jgi:hypothetical protein
MTRKKNEKKKKKEEKIFLKKKNSPPPRGNVAHLRRKSQAGLEIAAVQPQIQYPKLAPSSTIKAQRKGVDLF